MQRGAERRRQKRARAELAAQLSEENTFEWDAAASHDPEVGLAVLGIHNSKFKNNEKFEKFNYLDYLVKDSVFLDVDITSELNYVYLDVDTVSTTSLSTLEDDSTSNSAIVNSVPASVDAPIPMEIENIEFPRQSVDDVDANSLQDEDDLEEEDYEMSYMVPVPKNGTPRDLSLTPISIMVTDTIGLIKSRRLMKILFDPGSTRTLIRADVIPTKAKPVELKNKKQIKTISGTMNASSMVHLRNIKLPEFDKNCTITDQKPWFLQIVINMM